MSNTDEVYTDCPQCNEEIPFYYTVDFEKACPECGTHRDDLFELAEDDDIESTETAHVDLSLDAVMADGGTRDE